MNKHLEELKEAVAELAPYNDPTTRAIKAIAALILSAELPAEKPAENPAEAPKTPTP